MSYTRDPRNDSDRHQFISKMPSSSFLLGNRFAPEGRIQVVSFSVEMKSDLQFLAEARRLVSEAQDTKIQLLNSVETPSSWLIFETFESSVSPKSTVQGKTQKFLGQIHKMLAESKTDTKCMTRVMNPPEVPTGLEKTWVIVEEMKIKEGTEFEFVEACESLSAAAESTCGKCQGTLRKGTVEGSRVGVELQRDLEDPTVYSLYLYCRGQSDASGFCAGAAWRAWKAKVGPLLDGSGKSPALYRGVYHSDSAKASLIPPGEAKEEGTPMTTTTAASPSVGLCSSLEEQSQAGDLARQMQMVAPGKGSADLYTEGRGGRAVARDPKLEPVMEHLQRLYGNYSDMKAKIKELGGGSIVDFASAYKKYGMVRVKGGWQVREWLPGAKEVFLVGEFNEWDRQETKVALTREEDGSWVGIVPDKRDGTPGIWHKCKYKLHIQGANDEWFDRVPAWTRLAWKSDESQLYDAVLWCPPADEAYQFKHEKPRRAKGVAPKVYEAHIGISSSDEKVATYVDVADNLLPRVARLGYDTLLLIGVVEHANYSSAGKDVTSFFAPASRYGTPEELKQLIDTAHVMGISVLLDVLHSYASLNMLDGIADLDASEEGMFAKGGKGFQPVVNGKVFDFDKPEALRFLLSNLRYWMEEYRLDGFRFSAITSMMYKINGLNRTFGPDYADYFSYDLAEPAITYLTLANELVHALSPDALTIADENTGFPVLTVPVEEGGVGFDYRAHAGLPNHVHAMLRDPSDDNWSMKVLMEALKPVNVNDKRLIFIDSFDHSLIAKRPMKICMFSWESLHTIAVGGVAPHVTELAAALARLGHEVHVYVRAVGHEATYSNHYGVHYHQCTFPQNSSFVTEMMNMCESFSHFMHETEAFQKEKFQICHAHDWLAAKAIVHAKKSGHTCVQTMHSTEYGRCGNNFYGGQSKGIRDIEAEGCHVADRVICVSGVLAGEVIEQFGIHPEKIKVIYNGIQCEPFDGEEDAGTVKQKYGISAMDPTFLFVGRMVVQKGVDLLIEAIPMILRARGDAKFIIVGDGHMKQAVEGRANHLNVMHACRFLGSKSGAELRSIFKAVDAVLVPSRNEPFGIVVLEAWAAQKPVIATTCGGPRDFVSPGNDGWLVDPKPDSIAWGCCQILENFEHSRWMGTRGRVKAAFNFSWDFIARQTRDLYYEQLNRHDAPIAHTHEGEKSLAMALLGQSVYDHMTVFDEDVNVQRGLALHKCLRMFTMALGGNAYMNTMGNEFAHPEWIDFPRPGNNFSMYHARRRWDLADNKGLKFKDMELFDACLQKVEAAMGWMNSPEATVTLCHEPDKVIVFERAGCVFVFNFSYRSYAGYRLATDVTTPLKVALTTDESRFGGLDRLAGVATQPLAKEGAFNERVESFVLDLHPRTATVLAPATLCSKINKDPVMAMSADDFIDALASYKKTAPFH